MEVPYFQYKIYDDTGSLSGIKQSYWDKWLTDLFDFFLLLPSSFFSKFAWATTLTIEKMKGGLSLIHI